MFEKYFYQKPQLILVSTGSGVLFFQAGVRIDNLECRPIWANFGYFVAHLSTF